MKILLVEDMRAVAAVMQACLTSFGHEVCLAENGKVAVDKFGEFSPDLVLMDIEMPLMNGFEATTRIRAFEATKKWAWAPIIFLTASDTPENLVMAIKAGGDDFLVKGLPDSVLHAKMLAMERIAGMRRSLSTANAKLEHLVNRDDLTGMFNRRWMDLNIDLAWSRAEEASAPFAILMLDVDNFKKYNDYYGHPIGDKCLQTIADTIEKTVTALNAGGQAQGAFAARYGGEKFVIVIPGASAEVYESCAKRLLDSVHDLDIPHEQNGGWGVVTVSIGGCRRETATNALSRMFRDAEAALCRAKDGGRNQAELAT